MRWYSRIVSFQKGNDVSLDKEIRHPQFALGGSPKGVLRFIGALKGDIGQGEIAIQHGNVWIESEGNLGFID
jgi:hypothetical protein